MKKIYQAIILFLFLTAAVNSSAVITIGVANNMFTPSVVNAVVGDTIVWVLGNGSHTTTSTSVPAGATSWDAPLNSTAPGYAYVLTVAGTYDYHCSIHPMMVGQIVAATNNINTPDVSVNFSVYCINSNAIHISYTMLQASQVSISLFDLTGKRARELNSSVQLTGDYNDTYDLKDLEKGIYIVEMVAGKNRLTKRLIIN